MLGMSAVWVKAYERDWQVTIGQEALDTGFRGARVACTVELAQRVRLRVM